MIDIHSHILPGIDDGAKDFDDSINIIRELANQGVTDIIATPHYVNETIYNSNSIRNNRLLELLKERVRDAGIMVRLYLGNEIYIDEEIISFLNNHLATSLNGSEYLLVELSLSGEFPNYEGIIDELLRVGYKVILAHPERYATVQKDIKVLDRLIDMGVLLQCNVGSVIGQYGKHAKKIVTKLAKENKIFAFGSDIHHVRGTDDVLLAQKKLAKYYNDENLRKVLYENPSKIIS